VVDQVVYLSAFDRT